MKYKINKARIVSPIGGIVLSGDLKKQKGISVEMGSAMFEVGPPESLNADLSVPEDQIADVVAALAEARAAGKELRGELATASFPGERIEFVVERINPAAELVDQRNVYRVRVRLEQRPSWMLPGLEGIAKITIGRRSYAYLFSRRLVNWIRMKLWF